MVKTLVSDYHCDSIYKLDIDNLVEANIKLAFIDLDNTLAQYDLLTPEKRTYELLDKFRDKGIEVIVISNNRLKRVQGYVSKLNVQFLSSVGKPHKRKLNKFIISNCIDKTNAIIIGDQLLTDGLLSKHLDMKFILVDPVSKKDNFVTRINRIIERPLRKKYKKENRLGINLTLKED